MSLTKQDCQEFASPEMLTLEDSSKAVSNAIAEIKDALIHYLHKRDSGEYNRLELEGARIAVQNKVNDFGLQWVNVQRLMYVLNEQQSKKHG